MKPPVGILFAAAMIYAEWYVGIAWRVWGPSFVRGMTGLVEPLGGGQA